MRKIFPGGVIMLGSLLAISVIFSSSIEARATATWPIEVPEMGIQQVVAHDENDLTLMSCSATGNESDHVVATMIDGELKSGYPNEGTFFCDTDHMASITTPDGTTYGEYIDSTGSYIAAVKNSTIKWKTNIGKLPGCSQAYSSTIMKPRSMSVGADGNLYMIAMSPFWSYGCVSYALGLDAETGAIIFDVDMENGSMSAISPKIWTYEDKILTVDSGGLLREFDYSGAENVSAQYQFSASSGKVFANKDARVFLVTSDTWSGGCVSGRIYYHDPNNANGSMPHNEGCSGAQETFMPGPNGDLVSYIGPTTSYNYHVGASTPAYDTLSEDLPNGYSSAYWLSYPTSYYQDEDGNALTVRRLKSTTISNAVGVFVDYIDASTGGTTNIYSRVGNGTAANHPEARTPGFYGGYMYLPISHSYDSTSGESQFQIQKIDISGTGFGTAVQQGPGFAFADPLMADIDQDGLNAQQEFEQQTSDTSKDSDMDGIKDNTESVWYPSRDAVFCNKAATPYVCTYPDPIKKDVYVEIDWMNDNSYDFKPNSNQLDLVVDVFENKGINLHFDIGQLGGGNQLPALSGPLTFEPTSGEDDFYDLKNGNSSFSRQFSENRQGIWRYMITGKNFIREYDGSMAVPGTTGIAYAGDDDSMISMEELESNFPYDTHHSNPAARNRAVSGTILHELGHNLCLSDDYYTDQPAKCLYDGIDNDSGLPPINNADAFYNLPNYESVMNYRFQLGDQDDMGSINYSDGAHGVGDHDDWAGIMLGMADFVSKAEQSESLLNRRGFIQQPED